jgi:hypothetical protein
MPPGRHSGSFETLRIWDGQRSITVYKWRRHWVLSCVGSRVDLGCPVNSRIKVKKRTPCGNFASASSASTSVLGRVETDSPGQPRCWSSSQARPLCFPKVRSGRHEESWELASPGGFLTQPVVRPAEKVTVSSLKSIEFINYPRKYPPCEFSFGIGILSYEQIIT